MLDNYYTVLIKWLHSNPSLKDTRSFYRISFDTFPSSTLVYYNQIMNICDLKTLRVTIKLQIHPYKLPNYNRNLHVL